jgi:SagB-type dehydrogenase family enzyme
LRAPANKEERRARALIIAARLSGSVTVQARADGEIAACFEGYTVGLGKFSAVAADRAQDLRSGLPLASFAAGRSVDKEIELLVRRLARRGLLEYCLRCSPKDDDLLVIEPQTSDYWPRTAPLGNSDTVVLSRFAYLRRRANDMVLESPRAAAVFRLCDPKIAAAIPVLSTPQRIKRLRRQGFPVVELCALLLDCQIIFKIDAARDSGLRRAEGDDNLVLWDFHDLLFHTRSTAGRQANPLGGFYPYAGVIAPLPAVRPRWPGKKIDLRKFSAVPAEAMSPVARVLRARHSTRSFDDQRPITLGELSRFLDSTARVVARSKSSVEDGGPVVEYAARPYPAGGAAYELELYLAVHQCEGLARGFYHYDAGGHALMPIGAGTPELEALLAGAKYAMGAPVVPQVLITIAARFGRVSWKYSSVAYSLILKDVGVLTQNLYVMATDLGLGGCAIGLTNIDLFAKMTGIEFHVEGPVGQFALGRGATAAASS